MDVGPGSDSVFFFLFCFLYSIPCYYTLQIAMIMLRTTCYALVMIFLLLCSQPLNSSIDVDISGAASHIEECTFLTQQNGNVELAS